MYYLVFTLSFKLLVEVGFLSQPQMRAYWLSLWMFLFLHNFAEELSIVVEGSFVTRVSPEQFNFQAKALLLPLPFLSSLPVCRPHFFKALQGSFTCVREMEAWSIFFLLFVSAMWTSLSLIIVFATFPYDNRVRCSGFL